MTREPPRPRFVPPPPERDSNPIPLPKSRAPAPPWTVPTASDHRDLEARRIGRRYLAAAFVLALAVVAWFSVGMGWL